MRMFCSVKYDYNRNWFDVPDGDHWTTIENYFEKHIRIWDADVCGNEDIDFGITDSSGTKYYRLGYSWWIETDPEWSLEHSLTFDEITKEEATKVSVDRDWLHV